MTSCGRITGNTGAPKPAELQHIPEGHGKAFAETGKTPYSTFHLHTNITIHWAKTRACEQLLKPVNGRHINSEGVERDMRQHGARNPSIA